MKRKVAFLLSLALLSSFVHASGDEAAAKEKAQSEHNVKFPSFLSWKYCDSLKNDFMTSDMRSLTSYSTKHFDTKFKGPIKNTIRFIDQRKAWLKECDEYVSLTGKGRIFEDEKTTKLVFSQMDKVNKELKAIVAGATYSSDSGDGAKEIVGEKFGSLFKLVDDHKTLMHLKGKYVYR